MRLLTTTSSTNASAAPTRTSSRVLLPRSATAVFRRRLQVLLLIALTWCILWLFLSTEWIRRVDHTTNRRRGKKNDGETMHRSASSTQQEQQQDDAEFLPMTAYVEPSHLYNYYQPLHDTAAPPLQLRTHGPDALLKFTYPRIQTCDDIPRKLPVFHRRDQDDKYGSNVHNTKPLHSAENLLNDYAQTACPVDADPFLPWIHDVFSSPDGTRIDFVAHNKRRCNTDPNVFGKELRNLEPQVALWQPVPVVTIASSSKVEELVPNEPSLWTKDDSSTPRYRLATSFEEATVKETRFICQFHRLVKDTSNNTTIPKKVVMGETLSVYPYNYELANLRKPGSKPMLTRPEEDKKQSAHNEQVWNSVFHFSCPVPLHLQATVASGETVQVGTNRPTLFVDLVPIRTRPRLTRNGYVPPLLNETTLQREWGDSYVLPQVESSGRWSHIPICRPPSSRDGGEEGATSSAADSSNKETPVSTKPTKKKNFLIGCTWAAASFSTRGQSVQDSSTSSRLLEWLTYHLEIAGFDHMYVYDNTEEEGNTNLEHVTNRFPGQVTRIAWPHRVCNNNKPSHPNAGERSSQYAAETSCRVRYGNDNAEWMIFFDNDEYLIPHGKWTSIKEWLKEGIGPSSPHNILSLYQSRASPRVDCMDEQQGSGLLSKRSDNTTYLETYDCESDPLPKPANKWRAMKQLYRPWYVLNHFVHYSTVTKRILDHPEQPSPLFIEKAPFERRVDELHEAFMLHTKTTPPPEATKGWKQRCSSRSAGSRSSKPCPVGIPFPLNHDAAATLSNVSSTTGLVYNCYQHERIQYDLVPKLKAALLWKKES